MSQQGRGEKTKDRILEHTGKLAAEFGFDNVSLRDVSKRSGENLGSIYYHFKSKENLFEKVAEAAISGGVFGLMAYDLTELRKPDVQPGYIAQLAKMMIHQQMRYIFYSDMPEWHHQIVYQLIHREDELNRIFERLIIEPEQEAFYAVFSAVYPDITREQTLTRSQFIKMPLISHVLEKKMILRRLNMSEYTDEYLVDLEQQLVRQTLYMLGLPCDPEPLVSRFL